MRVLMVAPTPFFGDRGCHIRILEEIRAIRGLGVATILGDGSIALILDIDALVAPASNRHSLKGLAA